MDLPQTPTSNILLTGAGFTHNFGVPLAEGMWSLLFNHPSIKSLNKVKKLLRRDFDYESVYHEVMSGKKYSEEERSAINIAILAAYETIDATVRDWTFTSDAPYPVNIYEIQRLIDSFAGENRECGFFFTLNQDLFIERHYSSGGLGTMPVLPGIQAPREARWFTANFRQQLDSSMYVTLPGPDIFEEKAMGSLRNARFCYVKLHGSYGWRSHNGTFQIVIGGGKEQWIAKEPLLKWNFSLFKRVLSQPGRRLVVIGYGFRDPHVNDIITKAIKKNGLRLLILCPTNPAEFRKQLMNQKYGNQLWEGLEGYFPYSLLQLYPGDQSKTEEAKMLREAIFE
ncbi:MAG: SIR2 family protein [bacterium]|nr:SIR2 family protein [bacterium]